MDKDPVNKNCYLFLKQVNVKDGSARSIVGAEKEQAADKE